MPNIEIHGLGMSLARIRATDIHKAFAGKPYAKDMVVTAFPSEVVDQNGVNQPFLRLVNTKSTYQNAEILEILRIFKMDIEFQELAKFIPAGK